MIIGIGLGGMLNNVTVLSGGGQSGQSILVLSIATATIGL